MKIVQTLKSTQKAIQTWDESRKVKSPDILLAVFLNTYILTRIIPMPDMLANLFAAMAGALSGIYVFLWKRKLPIYGCVAVGILFSVCALVSAVYNHNGSVYYVLWVVAFLSVAMLMYSCKLNPRFVLAQFYAFSLILMIYAILGFSPGNFLSIGSENNISTYLILYLCVYLITRRNANAPVSLLPVGVALVLTMWTGSRAGMLALGTLLILALTYNCLCTSAGQQYSALVKKFVGSKRLMLIALGCAVVAMILVLTSDFFSGIIYKLTRYGGSSVRTSIWGEYFLHTLDKVGYIFLGTTLTNTGYTYLDKYSGNPHNSFLCLHAHFGLLPLLIMAATMIWVVLWSSKRREYMLLIAFLTASLRAFFDWAAFPGPYDVIYYYLVICLLDLFPVTGGVGHKAMHYDQKPEEVLLRREDLGGIDVKIYNWLKQVYGKVSTVIYNLSSSKVITSTATLYDTPTMTRYHHIVSALRYVAVEEHYGQNDFGKQLYIKANNWESEKALQEDLDKFDALIKSIETKGYDMNSGIYVDLDGNCINGTHRLALCAWFGVKQIPVITIKRHLRTKTIEQMKQWYHLSDEDFARLEEAYGRMREKLLG